MKTSPEDLNIWIDSPREGGNLEFKEAKTQFDTNRLFRYCVAIANEGGGKLILGVSDHPPRRVVGSQAFKSPDGIRNKILDKLRFRVDVDRNDRIRACYQHCCLRYVMNTKMTNQTLRERFKLPPDKSEAVSRMIRDTIQDDQIKLDDPDSASKRYARYVPYWA